jgi:uncharacterized protein (DUF2249 family)
MTTKIPTREQLKQLSQKAEAFYEPLRANLEKEHRGEYITIHPENGDYAIGSERFEAADEMRAKYPNVLFYSRRIGYRRVATFRGARRARWVEETEARNPADNSHSDDFINPNKTERNLMTTITTKNLPSREERAEIGRKAKAFYEPLREQLEKEHWGEYITINTDNGDYVVAPDRFTVVEKMRAKYPGRLFFLIRVGYRAVFHFRGLGINDGKRLRSFFPMMKSVLSARFRSKVAL